LIPHKNDPVIIACRFDQEGDKLFIKARSNLSARPWKTGVLAEK